VACFEERVGRDPSTRRAAVTPSDQSAPTSEYPFGHVDVQLRLEIANQNHKLRSVIRLPSEIRHQPILSLKTGGRVAAQLATRSASLRDLLQVLVAHHGVGSMVEGARLP